MGCEGEEWLWPRIKELFLQDVQRLGRAVGGWDLVFFTGDIVNSGLESQYYSASRELGDLWAVLRESGNTPQLCVVPGNHDLVRPPSDSSIAKSLQKLWLSDEDLRRRFWKDPTYEFRQAIDNCFLNYTNWLNTLAIPMVPFSRGKLPGDFVGTFSKGGISLGIAGLNSTFLQVTFGDYSKLLDIHVAQLSDACTGDIPSWLKRHNSSILLTHQPPSWFSEKASDQYRQEIYPSGRFIAHLCGHLHEASASDLSEGGGIARRLRQVPSLFGLETWEGGTPTKRSHGYNAGQYIFDEAGGIEKIWPRIVVKGRDGTLRLAPDHSYNLGDEGNVITSFDFAPVYKDPAESQAFQPISTDTHAVELSHTGFPLLSDSPDIPAAFKALASCPRLSAPVLPNHKQIRLDEQSSFEATLRERRMIWLSADWGIGKESFLACATDRFRTPEGPLNVFICRCDEATDVDGIQALFSQQFGMSIQRFCGLASILAPSFLLLDSIHPSLSGGEGLRSLQRLAGAIRDYCPNLYLVLASRVQCEGAVISSVELHPMEVPDVRTYLLYHPDATEELRRPETIERLYERSEGLPMHVDRLLAELKVSSLAAVLEGDLERNVSPELLELAPKALIQAISDLERSTERQTSRAYRLLKVLSVLQYGETLETLHHYLPNEPLFPQHALFLTSAALLDIIPIQNTSATVRPQDAQGGDLLPKVLRVPRQVRDYVRTRISGQEVTEIVEAGMDRFFGRSWRNGKVKLRSIRPEYREHLNSGAGNEFVLIHHLLASNRNSTETQSIERLCELAIQYVRKLLSAGRYRDLTVAASALLPLIDPEVLPQQWSRLSALHGDGLRMTSGTEEEALRYHKSALEVGEGHLSDEEKADIWLGIAMNEDWLGRKEIAITSAERSRALTETDSSTSVQAQVIIANNSLVGDERIKALNELERKARRLGYIGSANNVLLALANETDAELKKLKLYDRVLDTDTSEYTIARTIISKAATKIGQQQALELGELSRLCGAYGYFHAQRFGEMLDACHTLLWEVFEGRGDIEQLYKLFRHTSFVWRIRGEDQKEADYLQRLSAYREKFSQEAPARSLVVEVRYFMQRLRLVIVSHTPPDERCQGWGDQMTSRRKHTSGLDS